MPEPLDTASSSASPATSPGKPAPPSRHWGRWLLLGALALLGVLVVLVFVAPYYLDPWLHKKLEQQIAAQTHGQYRLQVGELRTNLWQRAIRLSRVRLRPAATLADTLPRVRLDVAQVNITGIGVLALLRKGVVPIDSIVFDSARIDVLALAKKPGQNAHKPLHERLPFHLKGLEIDYLGLLHTQATYLPGTEPTARFERADLSAHDLLISPAGAADTQRLGYAAAWALGLQQARAQVAGHRLALAGARISTADQLLLLDSLRIQPQGPRQPNQAQVDLALQRLRLTGFDAKAMRYQHRLRADSLRLQTPMLTVQLPAQALAANSNPVLAYLRKVDLAHLQIDNGSLRVAGVAEAPQISEIALTGVGIHYNPAAAPDSSRVFFAKSWDVALGRSQATVAGHALSLNSLHLATKTGKLDLKGGRVLPLAATKSQNGAMRVDLTLPALAVTGFDAAALQHAKRFQAESLEARSPKLVFTPPGEAAKAATESDFLRQVDVARLVVRNGDLRVAGSSKAVTVRDIEMRGAGLHYNSAAAPDSSRLFFAKSWDVALGRSQATVAGHALSVASLRLSTQAQTVALRSVRIRPPAPGQGKRGAVRVDLTMPSLAITGLDAAALQHQRHFQASTLTIRDAKLNFTPPAQPPPPVWKLLSGFVRRSDLNRFVVKNTYVQIGGLRHSPQIFGLNLTGSSIRIDPVAARMPARIAYAKSWQGNSGIVTAPFDPPYYRAASQKMRFDTDAQTLVFTAMSLTPMYSPVGMNRRKGYQVPAVSVKLSSLAANGLDFAGLVRRADFRIARVTVQRPVVRIASDGRGPINPNLSRVTPEEMRKLLVIIDVRQLDIKDGSLYSSYRSPRTPIVGKLSINRFNGSFRNLSNDPRRQTAATPFTGKATTYLQNRCRLDAQVSMYLLDPLGRHRVWGAFGPGPFAMLNSMTVPTRLVRFKRGDVRRLRFDLHADRQRASGTTWTEYSGLQLALLRYDSEEEEIGKSLFTRIKSKLANFIIIRDQNPRKWGKFKTGEMTSTRELRFSVFTLWRQGIVSGLFNNVGVPQKLAQKLSESRDEAPLPK